jgi:hypothetical protein
MVQTRYAASSKTVTVKERRLQTSPGNGKVGMRMVLASLGKPDPATRQVGR